MPPDLQIDSDHHVILHHFELPRPLRQQIDCLDWKNADSTFVVGPQQHRYIFLRKFGLGSYWSFARHYGMFMQRTCTMVYSVIPPDLDRQVTQCVSEFFGEDLDQEVVVRLQILWGPKGTALHTDPTRTVSLIYPLRHQHPARTCFYSAKQPITYDDTGMVNPDHYRLVSEICIEQPTLLDTKKVHAVRYDHEHFTPQSPRLSLSIKWKNHDFARVVRTLLGTRS